MRKFILAAAVAAVTVAAPAFAQDQMAAPVETSTAPTDTAPDGTPAFGIEPYFGIMGGWEKFDTNKDRGALPGTPRNNVDDALVQGVVGVNVPLKAFFVGVEGNVAKGVDGAIDWEYGAAGRFGVRAGDSGMFYGKVGYQWVNFDRARFGDRDYGDITYGVGFEVGPKDIGLGGITGNSGFRLRGEVSTFGEADSFRPMLGIITHF